MKEIAGHEQNARERLKRERTVFAEDLAARAEGILASARLMTAQEALERLSELRLGIALGLVKGIEMQKVDRLLLEVQPAHLQTAVGREHERRRTGFGAGPAAASRAQAPGKKNGKEDDMNNFTPRAQQVLQLSRQEADRFNHGYIGTEHLLLGLIALGQGVAVTVLRRMGLDLETVRLEVEKAVGVGSDMKTVGNVPYTPRVKKVLALAGTEARGMNVEFVGTEHILLGLLREGEGVAARVLANLHVDIEKTRHGRAEGTGSELRAGQQKRAGIRTGRHAAGGQAAGPAQGFEDPGAVHLRARSDGLGAKRACWIP